MQDEPSRGAVRLTFTSLAAKTVVCHTLTYFCMGALAFHFLHYADFIDKPGSGMRPTTDLLVLSGPALQVVGACCSPPSSIRSVRCSLRRNIAGF